MPTVQFTEKQSRLAKVFQYAEPKEKRDDREERDDRLVVRFDQERMRVYRADLKYRKPLPGATLLHYVETPATTPTGGRYTARRLTVRTADGRKWVGTLKNGTDVVRLRLFEE